ncbi:hypothetical protein Leryth_016374 [Lithospermum erythrorhizon]|nr:hypothetical protein Leryth_016374 [Lithospermum erythrorhizon]
MAFKGDEGEGGIDVISKILYAKELAREMEKGNNLIARDSPISRFVVSGSNSGHVDVIQDHTSSFVSAIQRTTQMPGFVPRMKRIGFMAMIALMLVVAVKKFFIVGEKGQGDLTTIEKKMLRRKLKARAKEEEIIKGTVEVIHKDVEVDNGHIVMPGLDREELMKDIMKAKGYDNELEHSKLLSDKNSMSYDFDNKIQEIKMMARHARETEKRDLATSETDEEDAQTVNFLVKNTVAQLHGNGHVDNPVTIRSGNSGQIKIEDTPAIAMSSDNLVKNNEDLISTSPILKSNVNTSLEIGNRDRALHPPGTSLADKQPTRDGVNLDKESPSKKLRVIRSVEEAREYLSRKHAKQDAYQENRPTRGESVDVATTTSEIAVAEPMNQKFEKVGNHTNPSSTQPNSTDSSKYINFTGDRYVLSSESDIREDGGRKRTGGNNGSILFSGHKGSLCDQPSETPISILSGEEGTDEVTSDQMKEQDMLFPPSKLDESSQPHSISVSMENSEARKPISIQNENNHSQNVEGDNMIDLAGHENPSTSAGHSPSPRTDNWLEKNFHELEPVIKKMAEGFRGNYMVAKETTKQDVNSEDSTLLLKSEGDSGELSWMKDEKLRDIVFRVRDNELAGREPFHQIDNESKLAFFNGLENKVEEENKKLLNLHKFLHLNIENLDYGADGISLYDPLEKIIPRWKGPPISEFLSEVTEDRISVVGEENIINGLAQNSSETPSDFPIHDTSSSAPSSISDLSSRVKMGIPKSSKTIIEGSDGSTKVGKKSGKEFWQHTKKWSQGFLSSYNEETDPEVKAVMKDIGKDLDRWITEKEIQEAAELMDKLPEGNQKLIKSKVDKVKREMELFGPQAVVSKYREYADVNEEDYLWWLDLPYVLCIELYMKEDGEQRTGLYSLEMAPDIELEPKPSHVIAFEDAGDCKSLCYIIQHHLEMIGNGNAFVVARPPKDAFREAKESGFSVTVIRKGELQLNVDQPLEEVEELIIEIGSKVYHDKIMKEHSVDMSGIMKGLFAASKPSRRRRTKRRLKNPTRH